MIVLTIVAVGPLIASVWESFHRHDLRMPWLGRPWIGFANYVAAVFDPRLIDALTHTFFFTIVSVALEIVCGLALAMALDSVRRGRGTARVIVLMPWALPTVVGALVWRFMFETETGVVGALHIPGLQRAWLSDPVLAWVPILLADTWKSTPFVTLLLLTGLQAIDPALHEAARMDGAGPWRRFITITLPLLRPALIVAGIFRVLDAFRVFDLVYVLTGGGPGTATEIVSLYAFTTLFQDLRFGYGSALTVITFGITFVLALAYIRALSVGAEGR
ncbi:MAG: carbohydrate ABC transporter permease [Vicinamibacterales bacterium]